jgi:hypothetical protein
MYLSSFADLIVGGNELVMHYFKPTGRRLRPALSIPVAASICVLLALSGAVGIASAAPVSPPAPPAATAPQAAPSNDPGTALTPPDISAYQAQLDAMQKLQRDNLQLKLQLDNDSLKAKIDASEGIQHRGAADQASPYVVDITGVGNQNQALIAVPGYGEEIVRAGDVLADHWTILSIDDAGVVATAQRGPHARRVRLPFQAAGGGQAS